MGTTPHVAIVGAGFGGLGVAEQLDHVPVEVTLIDQHNYHTFQPLLYQVATSLLNAEDVGAPVRSLFRHQDNVTYRMATVTGVDMPGHTIQLKDGTQISYDYLVLAGGTTVNYFNTPGAAEHAFPLYTLANAIKLRNRILERFEAADRNRALIEDGALNFVIVGAGPTGVETAGALSDLFYNLLPRDYHDLATDKARIIIVEMGKDDEAVKSVYWGPQGVLAHARRGSAIIDMSTVLPDTSRRLCDRTREAGMKCLDSPISGSTPLPEKGTLTLFCGGDEELFQAAQPIFSSIASQYFYLGGGGSGSAMKLVANTLLGVGMQAIAESVAFGQKEGLDRHRLLEVLSHTAVIAPAHLGKLTRADAGDYSAQFAIRLMNKDFGLVLETAAAAKVPMPATSAAVQMNLAEFAEGKEGDFSAVIPLMERLARVETSEAKGFSKQRAL